MNYTRRDLSKLAIASGAFAAIPMLGHAQEDWAVRLEMSLNARLERGEIRVTHVDRPGRTCSATLTLTWPPGTRRRRIEATGGYKALETAALEAFADALTLPTA